MTIDQYNQKAKDLNIKFPKVNAEVKICPCGTKQIKVANQEIAKILFEMYPAYNFTN